MMLVPKPEEFGTDSFAPHLQFPFRFDEINELGSANTVAGFEMSAAKAIAVRNLVGQFDEFVFRNDENGGFTITPTNKTEQ